MMKKNFIFTAILAVAISTIVSCNSDKLSDLDSTNIVTFGGAISRVTGNAFDNGDEISVVAFDSAGELFGDATIYVYSNGSFSSDSPIKLPEGSSLSYFASYIALENIEESFIFTIQTDQESDDGYEKSDLLIANVAESSSTNPTLQFSHTMSNLEVTINVVKDGVAVTDAQVSDIGFWAQYNATCDIATSKYQGMGSVANITPAEISTNTNFSLILAPQTIEASSEFASITIDEIEYTWSPSLNIEFESGLKYEYTWTIDQTLKTSEMTFTGDITSWGPGTILEEDDSISDEDNLSSDVQTSITFTSADFDSSEGQQTFTVNGVEFCTNFTAHNNYICGSSESDYLYNTTAFDGLSKVVIQHHSSNYSGTHPYNLYFGDAVNPSTKDNSLRDVDGDTYTYTITSGDYILIEVLDYTLIEYIQFTYGSSN